MMAKASGRSALIVAAGLFVCFAGPLPAAAAATDSTAVSKSDSATSGKTVRHARSLKRHVHRRNSRTAAKPADSDKSSNKVADAEASAIPASVANANAQMGMTGALPTTALAESASAMTDKANSVLLASASDQPAEAQAAPADGTVVASDQLNDVDRALAETPPKQQTAALAVIRPTSATARPAAASDNNPWDQTSLIGKLFIAFGALLTMASAARMFMA